MIDSVDNTDLRRQLPPMSVIQMNALFKRVSRLRWILLTVTVQMLAHYIEAFWDGFQA